MTQPAADQTSAGPVIAAATIGLALIAIESAARQQIQDTIASLYKALGAAALLAAAAAPGVILTGLALISDRDFHRTTTQLFDAARRKIRDQITTAYHTGAATAEAKLLAELDLPDTASGYSATPEALLRDIDTMFGNAQTDLQNTIITAFDPTNRPAIAQAIFDRHHTLTNRATATATTAVHKGSNEALQNLYAHYQQETGIPGLMKRWRTTSLNPCGMCQALNGTVVGITAEFDHLATTVDADYRPVWRNLAGPPRHPNCRCQLELVHTQGVS